MSVGGRIIEIRAMSVKTDDGADRCVARLWVVDRNGTETCVYAEPAEVMPALGDEVWWQSGKIFFDGDKRHLVKVGYSFQAPVAA